MKAYKLTITVLDFDELGPEEIVLLIEETKYPNHAILPNVQEICEANIGRWYDDHRANKHSWDYKNENWIDVTRKGG